MSIPYHVYKYQPVKTALISIYHKDYLPEYARRLNNLGIQIIASGGTGKVLSKLGISYTNVSEMTALEESPDHLVVTIDSKIAFGYLGDPNKPEHYEFMTKNGIVPIDLIWVDLYPYEEMSKNVESPWDAAKYIDIGGILNLRGPAKNSLLSGRTAVIVDQNDIKRVVEELENNDNILSIKTKLDLAVKAYITSSKYDTSIARDMEEKIKQLTNNKDI